MSFLGNTRIGARIALALVLPVVGFLVFSGFPLLQERGVASRMSTLAQMGPGVSARQSNGDVTS